jgi:hypothetical protein
MVWKAFAHAIVENNYFALQTEYHLAAQENEDSNDDDDK